MSDRQRNGFILLLVFCLLIVSGILIARDKTSLGLDLQGGVQLVYEGEPTPQSPVNSTSLSRAVDIMRQRVDALGVSEPQIETTGTTEITASLPNVTDTHRAENLVGTTARLVFYDWEANALVKSGSRVETVAQLLQSQDSNAIEISQGSGSVGPGSPGAGSLGLYQAVQLAATQPKWVSKTNNRSGAEYFMFGAPGSAACTVAAKAYKVSVVRGQHCYLAGPEDSASDLTNGLPAGVQASQGQMLVVQQGTTVLQAVPSSFSNPNAWSDPNAQYYALKDNAALFGNEISNPQQSTDSAGQPDVSFGFSGKGAGAFQTVTAQIARRGDLVSGLGQTYEQHFATALDTQLITVPQIDFKQYPDGIQGNNGAEITGGFTIGSAQDLATQLRLGALPIKLKLISESQVSATLGKQALNRGILAGAVGLAIVVIFLLAYYRLLGVIATAGLFVYAVYFFALIKLIPITLTLPGIAGLILTIGVAADANIVIFERVKEEIRGGRSIRQGIATGYRKGLTAIIDANVVTIMTAFILFVLATADVKGFAFVLGIGTFVSLFTAVMATQAILSTMGSSKIMSSPSLLGAGGKRRVWSFDFMGASRYFFSLSGVILLIGALAIGGKGLNLGIDFTSGTRITASLERPATQPQVASAVSAAGFKNPVVQKISNAQLGANVYEISAKQSGTQVVKSKLGSEFGLKTFDSSSVGPTFGKTVANSAVIAIIASLLLISVYVALRFEWKFAVPVLIALMHDLLITSGVYALTGREVTTATVAALLTILGYSLYDTIIVFDRVRENIPRMPRAAFSQIVNRSMSEVLTRSIATTSCTLMPIIALLLFGGVAGSSELQDFAFALLIGVASGAYSSIFIASPVLTHWKERESGFRARRRRIEEDLGSVPAYAMAAADIEPGSKRARRAGRLTQPDPETVSAAEFEQMKREIAEEEAEPSRHTSTLTRRLAHSEEDDEPVKPGRRAGGARKPAPGPGRPPTPPAPARPQSAEGSQAAPASTQGPAPEAGDGDGDGRPVTPAPDLAENDGVMPAPKSKPAGKSRSRNRRHGRRR
jgi:SecD/SecF fusion protein